MTVGSIAWKRTQGKLVWKVRVGPKDDRLLGARRTDLTLASSHGCVDRWRDCHFGAGIFPHEEVYLCAAMQDGEIIWKNDRISQADAGAMICRLRLSVSQWQYSVCTFRQIAPGGGLESDRRHHLSTQVLWRTEAVAWWVAPRLCWAMVRSIYAGGPHHFLAMNENDGQLGEGYISGRMMVLRRQSLPAGW